MVDIRSPGPISGVVSEVLSELFENCESELLDELSGIIEGSENQFFFYFFARKPSKMAGKESEIARKSPKTSCFEILRFESKLLTSPIVYLCSEYRIRQNGKRAVGSRFKAI